MEKILIVDDNVVNCNMLADVLQQMGYIIFQAFQGKEVIPMIQKNKPDLVLLDVMLPGMNGFEICKRIKNSPETENIAVILLTALNEVEDRTNAINVGADLFLSKPVNHKELKKQIEYALQNKNKIIYMEDARSICRSILKLMEYLNPEIYKHTMVVQEYSIKTAQLMGLDERMILRVKLGASFHDLGKILTDDTNHWHMSKEVLMPLRMFEWIEPYLNLEQSELIDDNDISPNNLSQQDKVLVEIVNVVNRFAEFWHQTSDQKEAITFLLKDRNLSSETSSIYQALKQVIDDVNFVRELKLE